jgi:hypothetical protein
VIHAAIFGAEEMVTAGLGGLEPFTGVPARHDVDLGAKRGHEEIVNRVLGRHNQLNLATDGNMQLIDFTLSRSVLKLPHPLLADDVDFDRVLGRTIEVEIHLHAPDKDGHGD